MTIHAKHKRHAQDTNKSVQRLHSDLFCMLFSTTHPSGQNVFPDIRRVDYQRIDIRSTLKI